MFSMYPFDHIRRNWDKRSKLHAQAQALLDKANAEFAEADLIENDDLYDERYDEIRNTTLKAFHEIAAAERLLCFPEPRNQWFKTFVKSFADGITRLSAKQLDVFLQYCEADPNTWRSEERYCHVGNRFITVCTKGSNRYVSITTVNEALLN